jgi:membrane-bound metal-dependent hydrolase YbcI (DUF457 family)
MSGYRAHFWVGTLFFVVLVVVATTVGPARRIPYLTGMLHSWWKGLALLATVLLAALWPDVDTNSKGRHVFYRGFLVAAAALILFERYVEAAVLGLLAILPNIGKHQGWTHTIWAALGVSSLCLWLPMYIARSRTLVGLPFAIAFLVGYLSHLVLDWKRS